MSAHTHDEPYGAVSLRAYFGRLHRLICSVSIIPSILSRFFLWLLQRSRMMALKSSLHRKSVYNECLSTKKILWIELIDNSLVMIESRQVAFSVQNYCVREERQVTLCLRSECLPAAFHNFYPKNWVFRLHPLTTHLPYTSLLSAVVDKHEKRPALPEKLNRASQKGK